MMRKSERVIAVMLVVEANIVSVISVYAPQSGGGFIVVLINFHRYVFSAQNSTHRRFRNSCEPSTCFPDYFRGLRRHRRLE